MIKIDWIGIFCRGMELSPWIILTIIGALAIYFMKF